MTATPSYSEYTRVQLGDLGEVMTAPMAPTERALILSTWMQSSSWRRKAMLEVLERGIVLVARSEGVTLGWLAFDGALVVHGYVKSGYRGNGVMRALWDAAGRPTEHVEDAHRRVRKVLEKLKGGGHDEATGAR